MLNKNDKQYIADAIQLAQTEIRLEFRTELNNSFAELFKYLDKRFKSIEDRFDRQDRRIESLYDAHDDHEGRIQNLELSF